MRGICIISFSLPSWVMTSETAMRLSVCTTDSLHQYSPPIRAHLVHDTHAHALLMRTTSPCLFYAAINFRQESKLFFRERGDRSRGLKQFARNAGSARMQMANERSGGSSHKPHSFQQELFYLSSRGPAFKAAPRKRSIYFSHSSIYYTATLLWKRKCMLSTLPLFNWSSRTRACADEICKVGSSCAV